MLENLRYAIRISADQVILSLMMSCLEGILLSLYLNIILSGR